MYTNMPKRIEPLPCWHPGDPLPPKDPKTGLYYCPNDSMGLPQGSNEGKIVLMVLIGGLWWFVIRRFF